MDPRQGNSILENVLQTTKYWSSPEPNFSKWAQLTFSDLLQYTTFNIWGLKMSFNFTNWHI